MYSQGCSHLNVQSNSLPTVESTSEMDGMYLILWLWLEPSWVSSSHRPPTWVWDHKPLFWEHLGSVGSSDWWRRLRDWIRYSKPLWSQSPHLPMLVDCSSCSSTSTLCLGFIYSPLSSYNLCSISTPISKVSSLLSSHWSDVPLERHGMRLWMMPPDRIQLCSNAWKTHPTKILRITILRHLGVGIFLDMCSSSPSCLLYPSSSWTFSSLLSWRDIQQPRHRISSASVIVTLKSSPKYGWIMIQMHQDFVLFKNCLI